MRNRTGFTLVEVLIAVVLIDVGLLALVAGSAVLIAQTNELRVRSTALRTANNRVQLLGGAPCAATSGSADGSYAIHERWEVVLRGNATREVNDSVTFLAGGSEHSVVLRTRLPC